MPQRLILTVLLIALVSCVMMSGPVTGQVQSQYSFESIQILVRIVSPTMAHVNRTVSLLVTNGNLTFLDWGLWYADKNVTVERAWDDAGPLQFIFPGPASQPGMPAIRIFFSKAISQGHTYDFSYEYDVTSNHDSFAWTETLDASQVSIDLLSVTISLPTGYNFTGIQPTTAITREASDGTESVAWTGSGLSGQTSLGLAVGYGLVNSQSLNQPMSNVLPLLGDSNVIWPVLVIVLAAVALGLRRRLTKVRRATGQPIEVTRAYDASETRAGTFCVSCGSVLPSGEVFCRNCGVRQPRRDT